MKKFLIIAASSLLGLFVATTVLAQVYPEALNIVDWKAAGTRLHIFSQTGGPTYINHVRGGASFSSTTKVLSLCTNCMAENVDAGSIQLGSNVTRPTCNSAAEGTIYVETHVAQGDGGDDAVVCLKNHAGVYAWSTLAAAN